MIEVSRILAVAVVCGVFAAGALVGLCVARMREDA
jgi:hypothetical protein